MTARALTEARRTNLRPLWLGLLLLGALLPSTALAQPDDLARSRELFRSGAAQYRTGKYTAALKQFEQALALARRPSILLNIAQCHRKLGNGPQALSHFKQYLELWERQNPGKPAPFKEEIQRHIKRLEARLKQDTPASKPVQTPPRKARPRVTKPASVPAAALPKPPRRPPPEPPQPAPTPVYRRWWFWTLVGVAVAGATTATVFALQPEDVPPVKGSLPPGVVRVW